MREESEQIQAELNALPLGEVSPIVGESPIDAALRACQVAAAAHLKDRVINSANWELRKAAHYATIIAERIAVLEALLRILPTPREPTAELIHDIRRFFAETGVTLDIKSDESGVPIVIPVEEPLLQSAIIDDLLPRLSASFPKRVHELVDVYHELLKGTDGDIVFLNAFKALEDLRGT